MLCLNCLRLSVNFKRVDFLELVTQYKCLHILNFRKGSNMTSCMKKQSSYFHTSSAIASELDFFKQHIKNLNKNKKEQLLNQSKGNRIFIREIEKQPNLSVLEPLVVSLDCEMVETICSKMSLARCSIVDYHGEILLDVYVKQSSPVVNYYTRYSGITENHLLDARCLGFHEAKQKVLNIIKNKLVVGHSLHNDLKCLDLSLPHCQVIDIFLSPDILHTMRVNFPSNRRGSLQVMSQLLLNQTIQTDSHCSVEDSRAAMNIFKLVSHLWLDSNNSIVQKFTKNSDMFQDQFWLQYTNN